MLSRYAQRALRVLRKGGYYYNDHQTLTLRTYDHKIADHFVGEELRELFEKNLIRRVSGGPSPKTVINQDWMNEHVPFHLRRFIQRPRTPDVFKLKELEPS